MNKAERQARHQERLRLKREREEKEAIYGMYYWRFYDEALQRLKELPKHQYPRSVSLIHFPSFRDHLHCRIEWNDESVVRTYRIWKFDHDAPVFQNMPRELEDPRQPEDYWKDLHPSIEDERDTLPIDLIAELVALLERLSLPLLSPIPNSICCDGESFELVFSHDDAVSRWKWHNELPETWKELEKIVAFMMELLPKS